MSIPYTATGRRAQKTRTMSALVDAAKALVSQGAAPTVEDAAAEAGISRTTAYRYFANQRELLAAAYPVTEERSLLPEDASSDPAERLDYVVDAYTRTILENESALRTALRLALEPQAASTEQPYLRRGRVIGWVADALAPLRDQLTRAEIQRLAVAIRASTGIESFIWLVDVAGLSRSAAVDVMEDTARALLRAAINSG